MGETQKNAAEQNSDAVPGYEELPPDHVLEMDGEYFVDEGHIGKPDSFRRFQGFVGRPYSDYKYKIYKRVARSGE
jgi:hypothetical protein